MGVKAGAAQELLIPGEISPLLCPGVGKDVGGAEGSIATHPGDKALRRKERQPRGAKF